MLRYNSNTGHDVCKTKLMIFLSLLWLLSAHLQSQSETFLTPCTCNSIFYPKHKYKLISKALDIISKT